MRATRRPVSCAGLGPGDYAQVTGGDSNTGKERASQAPHAVQTQQEPELGCTRTRGGCPLPRGWVRMGPPWTGAPGPVSSLPFEALFRQEPDVSCEVRPCVPGTA